jgi:class 3 adenylate cyclase
MAKNKTGAYMTLALGAFRWIIDAALWVAIGGLLVLFGLQFPHAAKIDELWLAGKLHLWGDPVLGGVAPKLGWAWPSAGISFLPIGAGFALLVAKVVFDALSVRFRRFVQKQFPLPDESLELSASASSKGISVSSTLLALAGVSDKAMAKVRRRYERVEQRINQAKRRRCAFLSIGVVDAIEMKQRADRGKIASSFDAYEAMVEEVLRLTGAWKQAWTPDGVMACYLDGSPALDAAQRVLKGLGAFNARQNELSHPFRVCCGLNAGEVAIFEDSKLQKVADRVIDVAGHMQKNARPNSLWVSAEVFDHLEEKTGFHPANAKVDGFTVFEWTVPEQKLSFKSAA